MNNIEKIKGLSEDVSELVKVCKEKVYSDDVQENAHARYGLTSSIIEVMDIIEPLIEKHSNESLSMSNKEEQQEIDKMILNLKGYVSECLELLELLDDMSEKVR